MAIPLCSSSDRRGRGLQSIAMMIVALAVGWRPAAAHCEDRRPELPRDGAWVQYQWDWERLDSGQKMSGKVTLRIVGSVVDKDEPCRWLELKYVIPEGNE